MRITEDETDLLRRLEESLWRADVRFDLRKMEDLLAQDFFEFGRSGRIHKREDTLKTSPQEIKAELPLPSFEARLIEKGVAQTTYISVVTYGDVVERGLRSSIWSHSTAGWKLRFHQGTPLPS
jgi:hypothetical protein